MLIFASDNLKVGVEHLHKEINQLKQRNKKLEDMYQKLSEDHVLFKRDFDENRAVVNVKFEKLNAQDDVTKVKQDLKKLKCDQCDLVTTS